MWFLIPDTVVYIWVGKIYKQFTFRIMLLLLGICSVTWIFLIYFCLFPSSFSCNKFFFFLRSRLLLISLYSTTLLGGSSPRKPNLQRISWEHWRGSVALARGIVHERAKTASCLCHGENELPDASSEWAGLVRRPRGSGISGIRQPALFFCLWPEATGSSRLHLRSSFYNGGNHTSKVCSN